MIKDIRHTNEEMRKYLVRLQKIQSKYISTYSNIIVMNLSVGVSIMFVIETDCFHHFDIFASHSSERIENTISEIEKLC